LTLLRLIFEQQERRVIEAGSKEDATKALAKIQEQMSASRFYCGSQWIEFLEGTTKTGIH
jgi:hypothetical protein